MWSSSDARSVAGQRILERIFRGVPFDFAAKLWDGTRIALGEGKEPYTLVFRSPAVFRSLMLRPTTRRFGEAYVNGDLDVEGDMFAAVALASRIEQIRLGLADRVAILVQLLRL